MIVEGVPKIVESVEGGSSELDRCNMAGERMTVGFKMMTRGKSGPTCHYWAAAHWRRAGVRGKGERLHDDW